MTCYNMITGGQCKKLEICLFTKLCSRGIPTLSPFGAFFFQSPLPFQREFFVDAAPHAHQEQNERLPKNGKIEEDRSESSWLLRVKLMCPFHCSLYPRAPLYYRSCIRALISSIRSCPSWSFSPV